TPGWAAGERMGEPAPGTAELLRRPRQPWLVQIAEGDAPSGLMKRLRDPETDARARSSHEHRVILEVEHGCAVYSSGVGKCRGATMRGNLPKTRRSSRDPAWCARGAQNFLRALPRFVFK